jgi:hypothetical protein
LDGTELGLVRETFESNWIAPLRPQVNALVFGAMPWMSRIMNAAVVNSVYLPSLLVRKLKSHGEVPAELLWYHRSPGLGEVSHSESLGVSRHIRVDRTHNLSILIRALIVELLLKYRFRAS